MIVNLVSGWGTAGPFSEDQDDGVPYGQWVDVYGVEGDFDNSERVPYGKLIMQSGCIGFPKGREWDGTPEDAIRLHALGYALLKSEIESGDTMVDEVEGVLDAF